jgi:hypothetical protein
MFGDNDPRTTGDHVRQLLGSGDDGDVILAGVVHDHPASRYRARSIVEATDPNVLALELPPMAIPLFERYADEDHPQPASGGEMCAAIRAGTPSAIVGIDGPTPRFLWRLVGTIYRREVELSTLRTLVSGAVSVSTHALACRLATVSRGSPIPRRAIDSTEDHDSDVSDPPREQAADERAQIQKATSVQTIFGESAAVRLRDDVREAHMADRLSTLRTDGTVVAVVGVGHLDSLAERLA